MKSKQIMVAPILIWLEGNPNVRFEHMSHAEPYLQALLNLQTPYIALGHIDGSFSFVELQRLGPTLSQGNLPKAFEAPFKDLLYAL